MFIFNEHSKILNKSNKITSSFSSSSVALSASVEKPFLHNPLREHSADCRCRMKFRSRYLPWLPLRIIRGRFPAPSAVRILAQRFSRFAVSRLPIRTDGQRPIAELSPDFRCFESFTFVQKSETVGFDLFVSQGLDGYLLIFVRSCGRKFLRL